MTGTFLDSHLSGTIGPQKNPCRWGIFNRRGGISGKAFASLNIGLTVGDTEKKVLYNRQRIKAAFRAPIQLFAHQCHTDGVYVDKNELPGDATAGLNGGCDALVTNRVGVALTIQHADCQAVLLYDQKAGCIAAIHNGWRGSVQNIVAATIAQMGQNYGSKAGDLHAIIGPSLGPCCAEFINWKKEFPSSYGSYKDSRDHFDFWQITTAQLVEAGCSPARVEVVRICTCCNPDWFSYRRACRENGGVTGRNCSLMMLC